MNSSLRSSVLLTTFMVALVMAATAAKPQSVQQSGTITPGHGTCWTTNGVIQDCGTAVNSFLTSLGVTGQGQSLCAQSAPITGPSNQICFNVSPTTLQLTFNNLNGATGQAQVCNNGFCSGLNSNNHVVVGVRSANTSTVTASATTDYFLCLDPTSNTITVNLPATPATGLSFLVKDCTGQSGAHAITVVPASGNIDGNANAVIGVPYQSIAVTFTGAQWSLN